MKFLTILTLFTITLVHLSQGGIFRRYVRKHRPISHISSRQMGPTLFERQFRIRRAWPPMFPPRRARAPVWPSLYYPMMFPMQNRRASRRYRFHDRLDNRVPQFHHQPVTARHPPPIGISTTTRLPSTTVQWRPFDYGNPIDRDPTYDYAPPAVERVRFVSEVRGGGRHPTARANTGMLGMYSRPTPVIVPAPWAKRDQGRARLPPGVAGVATAGGQPQQQFHQHHHQLPPPPRGAFPLWKLLAHKQRRRHHHHQRPMQSRLQQTPVGMGTPMRFIGQDPSHPLYHHQVFQDEAEVYPHIPNVVYFQLADVVPNKIHHAKKNVGAPAGLKPGSVSNAPLYSSETSSSSEFRPVKPTTQSGGSRVTQSSNPAYRMTVVGFRGPPSTTPMSPVAAAPFPVQTTKKPTLLYAVKTTPETLSTTHNSVVKPLEPTESLEPQEPEEEAASELKPVHVRPEDGREVVDAREQGGADDVDFDKEDEENDSDGPVVPNSFNIFDQLYDTLMKDGGEEEDDAEETVDVKGSVPPRVPIFTPTEEYPVVESTSEGVPKGFEVSTSISVSVGVSHSSSSSSSQKTQPEVTRDVGTDGLFAIRTAPTTTTTSTTTTTTEAPATTEESTTAASSSTTSTKPPSTSTQYPRLPTMPTYKRKPTPVYARKSSKAGGLLTKYSSSSNSVSKEVTATGGGVPNGSGEVVIITAGRSKVKEYKPQLIANQTHLLAFDKVVAGSDGEGSGVKESPILADNASPDSSSTTKSPLEDFDAFQLIHSWLNKS